MMISFVFKEQIEEVNSKLGDLQEKSDEMRNEGEQRSQIGAKERELAEFKDQLEKKESENERILKDFKNLQKDNEQLTKGFDDKNYRLKRVFHYKGDFDRNGVIYAMGTSFGGTKWENPSSKSDLSTRVTATRSSDKLGSASDLLNYSYKTGKESGTKDDNGSWWCVALSENYSLYLTHYTLRHGLGDGNSFLRHWKLEGSLDGSNWEVLKKHEDDKKLSRPSENFTATWSIDREVGAFRFFRIVQTGENSSGFLSEAHLVSMRKRRGN
ncbi:BTB/POZ domain-containing protein At2g30600-like isoform X2 [Stylophora pistillata]|uniref:BTB/POZ domain-containing protein At2g30600-like isoform X2 n=1 Tax=Stylophora pistillata TaxID=50429 RepID=UPI000C042E80|nr:BTB/POZ domain-containing protein At2g30600-like isoform X2 [Stylophora pistillata]